MTEIHPHQKSIIDSLSSEAGERVHVDMADCLLYGTAMHRVQKRSLRKSDDVWSGKVSELHRWYEQQRQADLKPEWMARDWEEYRQRTTARQHEQNVRGSLLAKIGDLVDCKDLNRSHNRKIHKRVAELRYEELDRACSMAGVSSISRAATHILTSLIVNLKDIQPEPEKRERKTGMNHTLTALLVDKEDIIQTVGVKFGDGRNAYVYKTLDKTLRKGDLVLVEVGTNLDTSIHEDEEYDFSNRGIDIAKVVDLEATPDFDSSHEYKWIIQKIDLSVYKQIREQENQLVKTFKKKELLARKQRALQIEGMDVTQIQGISLPSPELARKVAEAARGETTDDVEFTIQDEPEDKDE